MFPILMEVDKGVVSDSEKLRLIILYIISKNGITQEALGKLFTHAMLDPQLRQEVENLSLLGPNVVISGVCAVNTDSAIIC